MTMFPNLPQLHAQVIARMKERELKTSVGALIYVTRKEMIERGRPVNMGIADLDRDVRSQFVYVDPVKARQSAANLREAAEHAVGTPVAHQFLALADKFEADAKICEARAKGKSPAEMEKQINFYTSFRDFKNKWDDFYYEIQFKPEESFDTKFLGNEISNQIDRYYVDYIGYVTGFKDAGGVLAKPPPVASTSGDVHLPDLPSIGSVANAIPWDKVILLGLGGLAIYWVINRKPAPTPLPEAPRRIGPPEATSEAGVLVRAHEGQ